MNQIKNSSQFHFLILAAGLGERLEQANLPPKPLIPLCGQETLLARQVFQLAELAKHFHQKQSRVPSLTIATNSKVNKMMGDHLSYITKSLEERELPLHLNLLVMDTPSSFHTFKNSFVTIDKNSYTHLFVTMVDSIIRPSELLSFYTKCQTLSDEESAILTTDFYDDEKPLTALLETRENCKTEEILSKTEEDLTLRNWRKVIEFGKALPPHAPGSDLTHPNIKVTSGTYCFSKALAPLIKKCEESGMEKMRNFLAQMLLENYSIRAFNVIKTIDVDRPEDLEAAKIFLGLLSQ